MHDSPPRSTLASAPLLAHRRSELPFVLIAEDDADDRYFIERALRETAHFGCAHAVEDGEELMDYLTWRGRYADPVSSPRPALVLLDLNMPRKGGLDALLEIKAHPELRRIPIVVLTTSTLHEDIVRSYDLGASAYLAKPAGYGDLCRAIDALGGFYARVATLPRTDRAA